MTTTIRKHPLFKKASKDDRCIVCGRVVVAYDFSGGVLRSLLGLEIVNPSVCHVNIGDTVAAYPTMRS